MARISEAELERLKAQVSVQRLAEARGVKLRRRGKELVGLCPFHEDKKASLSINPVKNVWRCFGACDLGGSVVDWVMKAEGVTFPVAVEMLRAGLPSLEPASPSVAPVPPSPPVKRSTVMKFPGLFCADAEDQDLLKRVVRYYHDTLKQSPEALGYLRGRGLDSNELVERFQLGFCDRTLGHRIPLKNRVEGGRIRGRLITLGVLRETGHEHLRGMLTVPLFDAQGNLVQMYGRRVAPSAKSSLSQHLYLPGAQRGVWNLAALAESREVILCEALIDAMTFWCAGYRNVTAAYGVNGLTPDHWEAFKKYGTQKVWIAYDADEAGDRAAEKLARELEAAGIAPWRIQFPKGLDANAFACRVKPAAKSLGLLIRSAVRMEDGKVPATPARRVAPAALPPPAPRPAASVPAAPDQRRAEAAEEGKAARVEGPMPGPAPIAPPVAPDPPTPAPAISATAPAAPSPAPAIATAAPPIAPAPGVPPSSHSAALREPPPAPLARELATPPAPAAAVPPIAPTSPPALRSDPASAVAATSTGAKVTVPGRGVPLERQGEDLCLRLGDRSFRIRGLTKNTSRDVLKVNVLVSREGHGFHVDTFDLYQARQRQAFLREAASELGMEEEAFRKDLGRLMLALETRLEEAIQQALAPSSPVPDLSTADREAALTLLRAPDLLDQVLRDFAACGLVGEEVNKLVGYLAAVSRKLERPLAVLIQSSSAAGKSTLMDAVLAFVPEEEKLLCSALTGQALYYMQETGLAHKILAIAEEEGAQRASYSLKLLQSEGKLRILSTDKDLETGRHVAHPYMVEGPVGLFLSTTAVSPDDLDEELMNRCLVLTVDEGRPQTRLIQKEQRRRQTLAGLLEKKQQDKVVARHQNAQRLLRPLAVVNPFAEELTFLDHQTRTRRDHMKYLTLIQALALLHQYQREVKWATTGDGDTVEYIEATREDVAKADELLRAVLGHTLDELPPQTRRLLDALEVWVAQRCQELGLAREDFRFTRRDVREWSGLGNSQLKHHLQRLVEWEYLRVHAGGRGQSLVYELTWAPPAPAGASEPAADAGTSEVGVRPEVAGGRGAVAGGGETQAGVKPAPGRPQAGGESGLAESTETLGPSGTETLASTPILASRFPAGIEVEAAKAEAPANPAPPHSPAARPRRVNGG